MGRCYNSNRDGYKYYGGRGISVCKEWLDFRNFIADMDDSYRPKLTIDRKNNEGNYEPGNCRWVTVKENNRSKSNIKLTPKKVGIIKGLFANKKMSVPGISKLFNISEGHMYNIKNGKVWADIKPLTQ